MSDSMKLPISMTSPGVIASAPAIANNSSHSSQGLCRVCSANSTGVHYGVMSCEGCKAFFKRAVSQYNHSKCYFGGVCLITPETRGRCKACRLQKCLSEGMALDGTRVGRGRGTRSVRAAVARQSSEKPSAPAAAATSCIVTAQQQHASNWLSPDTDRSIVTRPILAASTDSEQRTTHRPLIFPPFRDNTARNGSPDENERAHADRQTPTPGTLGSVLDMALDKELQVYNKNSASQKYPTRLSFMSSYLTLLAERNRRLEDTVGGVAQAVACVYRGQIEDWAFFMEKNLAQNRMFLPRTAALSPEKMLIKLRNSVMSDTELLTDFCRALPGFSELSPHEQLNHAPYVRNGELFSVLEGSHYGRSWMDTLLDPRFVRFLFTFMEEVNELNLTLTENYLLLAVIVLQPSAELCDKDSVQYVKFLYSHYLDALTHLFSTRRSGSFGQLRAILVKALSIDAVHSRYVALLDFSCLPVRPFTGVEWSLALCDVPESTEDIVGGSP